MKIFWFDVETTGLGPVKNDIWQIAFEIVIDGELVATHEFKMRPTNMATINPDALAIGGVTTQALEAFPPTVEVIPMIQSILSKYVNKFQREDKLTPAGYNIVRFDIPFLRETFKKIGDKYYGSYFSNYALDVYHMAIAAHILVDDPLPKYKLVDVCAHHGISLSGAHDARFDIKATRELCNLLQDLYFKDPRKPVSIFF